VAPGGVSPMIGFSAILFIALGAGASGALNMWYDADIDIIMKRTRGRPVPSGRVEAGEALSIGIALSVMSVAMLGLATNWLAAGLLAFTIFFYAVIYTMWLKRLTPQNIVIGGAAGAFPPLIGWVAVTGAVSVEAVLMFGLIFMWTPPHFWALALFMKSDYHEAKVPMLTVTHGRVETRRQIWIYSLLLAPVALGLGLTSVAGPVYLAAAVGLNAIFLKHAFTVWRRDEATAEADGFAAEKRLFRFSLSYLFLHFGALLADAALRLSGVPGV
jgi:protoheme IX farnesyltransferase